MHELVALNAAFLHVVVVPAVLALLSTLAPVACGLAPLEGAGALVAALAAVVDVVAQVLLAPVVCLAVAVPVAGRALGGRGLAALAVLAFAVLTHDAAVAAVVGVVVDAGLAAGLGLIAVAALVALTALLPRISTPNEEDESQSNCHHEELLAPMSPLLLRGRHL